MKKELGSKIKKSMEKCWGSDMQKSEDKKPIDNSAKDFLKEFGESKLLKADMPDNDSQMDNSLLKEVKHHVAEIEANFDFNQDLPDWVDALITEASDRLSKVAHFIQGSKQGELQKSIAKKLKRF